MPRTLTRARLGLAVALAFFLGLTLASGFDLTRFGYAQQSGSSKPTAREVQPVLDLNNAFVSIAEHVTPAVVRIETERDVHNDTPRLRGKVPPGLEDFFRQFQDQTPEPQQTSGSGFLVSKDGYILTNNHVVAGADRMTVTLTDGRVFSARIVGRDPTTDIAVIKVDGHDLPTVALGDDDNARVGEWVLAIGNPLGLNFTVTAGIVSAKGRAVNGLIPGPYSISDYIQTDAAINPGNSGGPLVDIHGDVIGVNAAIASNTGFYEGYGFAIPISLARQVMQDLIAYGKVRRSVLGVSVQEVDAVDAKAAGLTAIHGAKVGGYSGDDSPARIAGVQPGDIIISADGKPVDKVSTLQRIVRAHKPGDMLDVTVMRYGQEKTFHIKLAEAPSDDQLAANDGGDSAGAVGGVSYDKLGVSVEPIPQDIAREANLRDADRGVLVTDIGSASPARDRLFERDVIVRVLNPVRRDIRTPADLEAVLRGMKSGDIISLEVYALQDPAHQTRVVNVAIGG